jgi:hypothetical protein
MQLVEGDISVNIRRVFDNLKAVTDDRIPLWSFSLALEIPRHVFMPVNIVYCY